MKTAVNNRPNKGKSLISFPNDCTVLDLETTGLYPQYDEIIEFAAIRIRGGVPVESFSSLASHGDDFYLDDFIQELTGITQKMIDQAPDISVVFPRFLEFVGEDIVIGHNVNFDVNFIYDLCSFQGLTPFSNNYVDTMRISRRLHPEHRHHRLCDLCERCGIDYVGAHRSLADCDLAFRCFCRLKDEALSLYGDEESFLRSVSRRSNKSQFKPSEIKAECDVFDESHPLYGMVCVFTGALEKMPRREAAQYVVNLGGIVSNTVTSKTNFLILGNNDYCRSIKDGKSTKQKKAEGLILKGQDLQILPESVFYDMISEK